MKICVCVKHVPDTAATIKLAGENGFKDSEIKFVVNPYDEYGVEEAVSLVEKQGGEVVIVTVGKAAAAATIRGAMAMGAHRAILVKTQGQFLDSGLTAHALKAVIEQDGLPDMIFTGKGSVDTESFQTQYRLAKSLSLPIVNEVSKLTVDNGKAVTERETGGGRNGSNGRNQCQPDHQHEYQRSRPCLHNPSLLPSASVADHSRATESSDARGP